MKQIGKFILLDIEEFSIWINGFKPTRKISNIQQHHTWIPSYKDFDYDNHFRLCDSMERNHIERKLGQIAQNFTTFPDGKIMICRDLNIQPTGIKNANKGGICIENLGDFDKEKDIMTDEQRSTIINLTKMLLNKYELIPSLETVVYHHWFDIYTGNVKPTTNHQV